MNYDAIYRGYMGFIEPALEEALIGLYPVLKDAMAYSLMNGGKRLRPVLTLAACDAVGGDIRRAVSFASAIEMIHTYSLIHDDLPCMDDDDMRRANRATTRVYGEGMAVLAGDGLLSLAFEVMSEQAAKYPANAATAQAMYCVARNCGVSGMVSGQARDLASEGKQITSNELRRLQSEKTSALISAACIAGALIGGGGRDAAKGHGKLWAASRACVPDRRRYPRYHRRHRNPRQDARQG